MEQTEEVTPAATGLEDAAAESVEALPLEPQRERNVLRTVGIVLTVLALLLVISAMGYGLVAHPVFTSILRDIAIIVLAFVTMITCVFLAILLFQLQSLIVILRDEIQPILESVNDTAGAVRGTTTFVSDAVVTPMIQVASYASGVGQTIRSMRVLFGGPRRRTGSGDGPEQA
jgi:hypothetical protein